MSRQQNNNNNESAAFFTGSFRLEDTSGSSRNASTVPHVMEGSYNLDSSVATPFIQHPSPIFAVVNKQQNVAASANQSSENTYEVYSSLEGDLGFYAFSQLSDESIDHFSKFLLLDSIQKFVDSFGDDAKLDKELFSDLKDFLLAYQEPILLAEQRLMGAMRLVRGLRFANQLETLSEVQRLVLDLQTWISNVESGSSQEAVLNSMESVLLCAESLLNKKQKAKRNFQFWSLTRAQIDVLRSFLQRVGYHDIALLEGIRDNADKFVQYDLADLPGDHVEACPAFPVAHLKFRESGDDLSAESDVVVARSNSDDQFFAGVSSFHGSDDVSDSESLPPSLSSPYLLSSMFHASLFSVNGGVSVAFHDDKGEKNGVSVILGDEFLNQEVFKPGGF